MNPLGLNIAFAAKSKLLNEADKFKMPRTTANNLPQPLAPVYLDPKGKLHLPGAVAQQLRIVFKRLSSVSSIQPSLDDFRQTVRAQRIVNQRKSAAQIIAGKLSPLTKTVFDTTPVVRFRIEDGAANDVHSAVTESIRAQNPDLPVGILRLSSQENNGDTIEIRVGLKPESNIQYLTFEPNLSQRGPKPGILNVYDRLITGLGFKKSNMTVRIPQEITTEDNELLKTDNRNNLVPLTQVIKRTIGY